MKPLEECTILIVDDTKMNIDILVNAMGDRYDLSVAMNGPAALQLAKDEIPDLILLDIMMPGMDGFEVLEQLKADKLTKDIPVILLSALSEVGNKAKGFTLGAVDYIIKPFHLEEVFARINTHLKLKAAQSALKEFNDSLQARVAEQVEELNKSQLAMIFALAKLSHTRDDNTGMHLERVQHLCKELSLALGEHPYYQNIITTEFADVIYHTSPLHDVGKVGIEDAILLKPGKLSQEEFEIMKTHTTLGSSTLESVLKHYPNNEFIKMGIAIARHHHEKWDGKGYPDNLCGTDIPLSARIMALVDVYDALRTKRPYKEPFTHERSINIIQEQSGTAFDPDIAEVFLQSHERFDNVYNNLMDEAEVTKENSGA